MHKINLGPRATHSDMSTAFTANLFEYVWIQVKI